MSLPYTYGHKAALLKFGEMGPLIKAILEHAAAGAGPGAALGAATGAIAAPRGQRWEGAGRGALAGGVTGGVLGGAGRALIGRHMSAHPELVSQLENTRMQAGLPGANRGLAEVAEWLSRGGAAATGGLGGGIAGAVARPDETWTNKLKNTVGF